MKKNISILFFQLVQIISFSLFAQEKWSLDDCIVHAKEHNVLVQKQKFQNNNYEDDIYIAKGKFLPDANLFASQNYNLGSSFDVSTNIGQLESRSNSFSLAASVPIFNGFSNRYELKLAKSVFEKGQVDIAKIKLNITIEIIEKYLKVLFDREILKVAEKQVSISDLELIRLNLLFNKGLKPKDEYLEIKSVCATDAIMVTEAKNNLLKSYVELKDLLDIKEISNFDVKNISINQLQFNFFSKDSLELINEALVNAPDIQSAGIETEINKLRIKIENAKFYPVIDLNYSFQSNFFHLQGRPDEVFNPVSQQFEPNGFFRQLNNNKTHFISFSARIPIFNRFLTKHSKTKQEQLLSISTVDYENEKKKVKSKILNAFSDAEAAQKILTYAKSAEVTQSEAFQLIQIKFNKGIIGGYEFLESKSRYILAASNLVRAKYDYLFKIKIIEYYLKSY